MRTTLRTVAVALVVVGTAAPVLAGQARPRSAPPSQPPSSGSSEPSRESSRPQAQRREAPPPPSSMPQQDRRQDDRGRNDTRTDTRSDTRSAPSRQAVPAPRDRYIDLNRNGRDNRYDSRDSRYDTRYDGRDAYRYDSRYDSRYDTRYDSRYDYRGPRIVIAPRQPVRFSRPWYTFLPQLRLSIGITIGRPIAFPSWYDPYIVGRPGYEAPYMAYGGVSFDVEPRDAELWIDGEYVGRVSDYSPYDAPLVLAAGRHVVDLRGRYYNPLTFEITVVPGQVIPYSGTLPYYR